MKLTDPAYVCSSLTTFWKHTNFYSQANLGILFSKKCTEINIFYSNMDKIVEYYLPWDPTLVLSKRFSIITIWAKNLRISCSLVVADLDHSSTTFKTLGMSLIIRSFCTSWNILAPFKLSSFNFVALTASKTDSISRLLSQ